MPVIHENTGVLDERALFIQAVNVKQNAATAIGFFGTGMKYGVAICARLGWTLIIQPGDGTEHTVQVSTTDFRGKEFIVPQYRGRDLPVTIDYGKTWEPWEVYREFHCNAQDEYGRTYVGDIPLAEEGMVRFIVVSAEAERIHSERTRYFWQPVSQKKLSDKVFRSRENPGTIFYKGVRVGELPYNSRYSYNIMKPLDLTENRTLGSMWQVNYSITGAISSTEDEAVAEEYLTALKDTYEHNSISLDFNEDTVAGKVAIRLYKENPHKLKESYCRRVREMLNEPMTYDLLDLDSNERVYVTKATTALERLGYRDMPIRWKADLPDNLLGLCVHKDKAIWIGVRAFEEGYRAVLATAIEECIHLKDELDDYTRQFQDKVLRMLVSQIDKGE